MKYNTKIIFSLMLLLPATSFAQPTSTLGQITVTASRSIDIGSLWQIGISNGGGEPFPGYRQVIAFAQSMASMKDVRCAFSKDQSTITSHASIENRKLAAEAVYRTARIHDSLFSRRYGRSGLQLDKDDKIEVTYADGGTETFIIEFPLMSSALSYPVPGSLKPGDGVPNPHILCPTY